jgi:hypothetical protein
VRCLPSYELELELELKQTQMTQKPMLRVEVYARALRASQNVKRAEVWWVWAPPLVKISLRAHLLVSVVYLCFICVEIMLSAEGNS